QRQKTTIVAVSASANARKLRLSPFQPRPRLSPTRFSALKPIVLHMPADIGFFSLQEPRSGPIDHASSFSA
ncbi:hypothetical protein, partial [Pseudomonas aeruginosa]|uniref:hypothetical protein n=1 Tax=Pseudomonas aeruginosa TaxID=287 RepID=UPI001A9CE062